MNTKDQEGPQLMRDGPDEPKTPEQALVAYAFQRGRADQLLGVIISAPDFPTTALYHAYLRGMSHESSR